MSDIEVIDVSTHLLVINALADLANELEAVGMRGPLTYEQIVKLNKALGTWSGRHALRHGMRAFE